MSQETYSLLALDEDVDEDRNADTKYAPFENMLSAAHLMTSLLVAQMSNASPSTIAYAIQGGFSMQLRGGRQSTRDIDLLTTHTMKGIWDTIRGKLRIIIPDSRLVEGVLKVFVKTGAPWDACAEQHRIEVDIKQAGLRGSPRRLDGNVEKVGPFDFFETKVYFNILNIISMIRIKVECCLSREEVRDFEDVRFMIRSYPTEVREAIKTGILYEEDVDEVLNHEKTGNEKVRDELIKIIRL